LIQAHFFGCAWISSRRPVAVEKFSKKGVAGVRGAGYITPRHAVVTAAAEGKLVSKTNDPLTLLFDPVG
jgi:hypothetical protein